MKFHISDVLSATTGRPVSNRHMQAIYEILNYMTGDQLDIHQLPRARKGCEPGLRRQYPQLMHDAPEMAKFLDSLTTQLLKVITS